MKYIKIYFLLFWLVLFSVACNDQNNQKITIATSANMQFTMKALTTAFTTKNGIECELVISSSGKLTAQIKEGAPYDIFVAADMKYPNEVFNSGLSTFPPKIYAHGKLVLWSVAENITPSLKALQETSIKHIALANPKTAPYGIAAVEVLEKYHLLDSLKEKLVYGESISQTNQFIISKSAEAGFTAMSVVLSDELKNKGNWVALDEDLYTPLSQGVVLIKNNIENNVNAQQFYDFLFSDEAKEILKKFGYSVDK